MPAFVNRDAPRVTSQHSTHGMRRTMVYEALRAGLGDCESIGRAAGAMCFIGVSRGAMCFLTTMTANIF